MALSATPRAEAAGTADAVAAAADEVAAWLGRLDAALAANDFSRAVIGDLFDPQAFWRDLSAFTWNIVTMEGAGEIRAMLEGRARQVGAGAWALLDARAGDDYLRVRSPTPSAEELQAMELQPLAMKAMGEGAISMDVLRQVFGAREDADFDEAGAKQLLSDAIREKSIPSAGLIEFETDVGRAKGYVRLKGGKCVTLLTVLQELKGHEEATGIERPRGTDQ